MRNIEKNMLDSLNRAQSAKPKMYKKVS